MNIDEKIAETNAKLKGANNRATIERRGNKLYLLTLMGLTAAITAIAYSIVTELMAVSIRLAELLTLMVEKRQEFLTQEVAPNTESE